MHDRARLAAIVSGIRPVDQIEADHRTDTLQWIASDAVLHRARPGEFVAAGWWSFDEVTSAPAALLDPHLPRFVRKLCGEIDGA